MIGGLSASGLGRQSKLSELASGSPIAATRDKEPDCRQQHDSDGISRRNTDTSRWLPFVFPDGAQSNESRLR